MGIEVAIALAAVSAAGSMQQSKQQESMARMNAKQAKFEAEYNAKKAEGEGEKLKSRQKAAYGASGVMMDGTPAAVLAQTDADAEMRAMEILYGGQSEADLYNQQADNIGNNALMNAGLSGAQTFLGAGGGKTA